MALFFAQSVGAVAQSVFGENIHSVKLFGSFAKGTPRMDSDIDVMVILNTMKPAQRQEVEGRLYEAVAKQDIATEGLHILPVELAEFTDPNTPSTVLQTARGTCIDIPLEKPSR